MRLAEPGQEPRKVGIHQALKAKGKQPRPTEEEPRGQGGHHGHVDVLGQVEEAELHARVLGVEARHQLVFGLWHIEGEAVGFREAAGEVDQETQDLGRQTPEGKANCHAGRHLAKVQAGREHHRGEQAHRQGHFVADHLGRAAQAPQQGILGIGRPAGQHDAVHPHARHAQDPEQAHVDVGDAAGNREAPHVGEPGGQREEGTRHEGNGREHHHGGHHAEGRRNEEHELVGLRRKNVLLEDQLQHVRHETRDAAPVGKDGHPAHLPHAPVHPPGDADVAAGHARGAQALLKVAEHLAFGEHRQGDDDKHKDHHHYALEEGDHDGLSQGGSRHGVGSSSASGRSRRARCRGCRWPPRYRRSGLPQPSWAGTGG